jgi:uncharacterized membrane protein
LICVPIMAAQGVPAGLKGMAWLWLALSGAGNVAGLLLTYAAFRTGQVALVTPGFHRGGGRCVDRRGRG